MSSRLVGSVNASLRSPALRGQRWWIVDAYKHRVGRLASQIPKLLTGKGMKPTWTPTADCGDYVVVVNAKHVEFSGHKWQQKYYRWHTGWVGHLKEIQAQRLKEKDPQRILRKAIVRMLKKTPMRRVYNSRLLIFPDQDHPFVDKNLKEFVPLRSYNEYAVQGYNPELDDAYDITLKQEGKDVTLSAVRREKSKTKKLRQQRGIAKAAGLYGNAAGPNFPDYVHGFAPLGPAVTPQELHFLKKLISSGYNGENWPQTGLVKSHMDAVSNTLRKSTTDHSTPGTATEPNNRAPRRANK
eukprot:TRINITY_DN1290_c0_g1_i1.p1 TRINITY_DN1290_c0_g1~~TRINITY_DN1290_c0_g1_i1.p1  ORF type:complete len:297 (+),score=34.21 TRINITY_DN1290_c0_g1_i1:60-950(+)